MNATRLGVAFSAAKMRSPSFSRSSSSMTMTALPAAMSATARSPESNLVISATLSVPDRSRPRTLTRRAPLKSSSAASSMNHRPTAVIALALVGGTMHQPLDVFGDDVDLEVDGGAHRGAAQRGQLPGGRNQRDLEPTLAERGDRQRDAVHRERALLDDVAGQRFGQLDAHHFPAL